MQIPSALNIECPICGTITIHHLKKGKLSEKKKIIYDTIVECTECKHIHHSIIEEEKNVNLPVVISSLNESKKDIMSLPPRATMHVGDELMLDNLNVKITGIELKNKRVNSAKVADIQTLWCKRFDKIKLKIAIHSGSRTLSRSLFAVPDEEFYIGDIIRSANDQIAISKIKTKSSMIKTGGTTAREIVRLYGRFVR